MTDRREFIGTVGLGLLATLAVAAAQPVAARRRVVVLTAGANPRSASFYVAFEGRLHELGWIAGRTIDVEFAIPRPGETSLELAAGVIRSKPDVIVTPGPEESLRAARQSTTTIPIVIVAINYDPVAKGYVASLARPAGNVTGVFFQQLEADAKQLELLTQILPKGASVAVMWERSSADQLHSVEAAARSLGVSVTKIEMLSNAFEAAFRSAQEARAAGVMVLGSPVVYRERGRIGQLALRYKLPSAGTAAIARDNGFLLGFGPDLDALFRRAAEYVDKLLRGAKPADLPVEQPTKFELVINLKTAKALGLTIPQTLLLRADQVIE